MKRQSISMAVVVFMAAALTTSATVAQLHKSLPFARRVNSDPSLDLSLSQQHGPWLIMCASFVGERAEQQARQLALELRRDHNMKTYLYRHTFDYSDSVRGLGWEPYTTASGEKNIRPLRMKAAHPDRFDEIAVLVGDFSSVEDASSKDALQKIKYLKPRSLEIGSHIETSQSLGALREFHRRVNGKNREKGPMRSAFLMPNPMLPADYFQAHTVDKLVLNLNKGIRHSLLDCPGRYSVRVATFRGDLVTDAREINAKQKDYQDKLRFKKPITDSKLAEAGNKAHVLCKELRKMGVEAYEFHDRYESYVCVGSFDWATRKLQNGKDELNPEVAKIIKEFKAQTPNLPTMPMVMVPRTLKALKGKNINFDAQPLPVVVPKMHVSTLGFNR